MPVVLLLRRLGQEDQESETSMGYMIGTQVTVWSLYVQLQDLGFFFRGGNECECVATTEDGFVLKAGRQYLCRTLCLMNGMLARSSPSPP